MPLTTFTPPSAMAGLNLGEVSQQLMSATKAVVQVVRHRADDPHAGWDAFHASLLAASQELAVAVEELEESSDALDERRVAVEMASGPSRRRTDGEEDDVASDSESARGASRGGSEKGTGDDADSAVGSIGDASEKASSSHKRKRGSDGARRPTRAKKAKGVDYIPDADVVEQVKASFLPFLVARLHNISLTPSPLRLTIIAYRRGGFRTRLESPRQNSTRQCACISTLQESAEFRTRRNSRRQPCLGS